MIVPKITYDLLLWGACSKNLLQKIECQHIKAARTVRKTMKRWEMKEYSKEQVEITSNTYIRGRLLLKCIRSLREKKEIG